MYSRDALPLIRWAWILLPGACSASFQYENRPSGFGGGVAGRVPLARWQAINVQQTRAWPLFRNFARRKNAGGGRRRVQLAAGRVSRAWSYRQGRTYAVTCRREAFVLPRRSHRTTRPAGHWCGMRRPLATSTTAASACHHQPKRQPYERDIWNVLPLPGWAKNKIFRHWDDRPALLE